MTRPSYSQILDLFEKHHGTALSQDDARLMGDLVEWSRRAQFVVDLERHNDGETGLVGPFDTREEAQQFIDGIPSRFERDYATIRSIEPVPTTTNRTTP